MTSLILFVLKENKRRILSWVCFICMLFNTLPVASFASEFEGDLTEPVEVVQDVMPDDNDPVVPAAQEPADPVDSQDPSDPPADATDGEEPAADDHDDPQSEPAAEESNIISDNSADIVPDVDVLEPDTNDIVPEGQDVPSAEEVVLPSLFIDFPATGVFSGDTLSVSYKYTSAKNEELVISLDNIAAEIEVKYLSDEMPVEAVRTEDEETGYAYYRLSTLKDEVYLIRVFVEKADEEIPYSITITEYVEPSADVEPEVQNIEPDNTGDALIDIPPEVTDDATEDTNDTTDTETESNIVDIFPDLPNNEDTSAFDNFLNGNTEPTDEQDDNNDQQEPVADISPDESGEVVEPVGQEDKPAADEPTDVEPIVDSEDNQDDENADNEPQDAENPASDDIIPDIIPDAGNEPSDAFDGFPTDNTNDNNEPEEDATPGEPLDEGSADEGSPDELPGDENQDEEEKPEDFLVVDDEEEDKADDEAASDDEQPAEDTADEEETASEDEATDEEAEDAEVEEDLDVDEETFFYENGVYTYTGHGLTVSVEASEENGLPEGTEFVLIPVSADEERVAEYVAQAAELNGVEPSSIIPYVFDMHFEYEGEEVAIAEGSTVHVNIHFDNALELGDVIAAPFYHIESGKLVTLIQDVTRKEEVMPMRGAKGMMKAAPAKAVEKPDEDKSEEEEPKEENKTVESIDFTVGSFSDFMLTGVRGVNDVYAMLYSNGDLVFQLGDTADPDKGTVTASWNYGTSGVISYDWRSTTYRNSIIRVYINTPITYNGSSMFDQLSNLEYIYNMENLTVINLTTMFRSCKKLKEITGFDSCNYPSNISLTNAFLNCNELVTPINIIGKNIQGIDGAFQGCYKIPSISLSGCTLSGSGGQAFYECKALTTLDLSNLSASSTPSTSLYQTFNSTLNLQSLDLSNTFFSDCTGNKNGFLTACRANTITFGTNFQFGNGMMPLGYWVRQSTGDVYCYDELTSIWDSSMADTYIKFTPYAVYYSNGDLVFQADNTPDVSRGTVIESWPCPAGTTDAEWLGAAYIENITDVYINVPIFIDSSNIRMFNGMTNVEHIYNIDNVNVSYINSLKQFFYNCKKLVEITGLNQWDLSSISDLEMTFQGCESFAGPIDLSGLTLNMGGSLKQTFKSCYALTSVDLSNSVIQKLDNTFYNCTSLSSVDFTGATAYNSSINIDYSFYGTTNLPILDMTSSIFSSTNKNYFLERSGVSTVVLGQNFQFGNGYLPTGVWQRESTGDLYTASDLKNSWNSALADTYRKISKYVILYTNGDLVFQDTNVPEAGRGGVVKTWECPGAVTQKEWAEEPYCSKVTNVYINTSIMFPDSRLFLSMRNMENIYHVDNINLSNQNNLSEAFRNCEKLNHIYGLADWDVHTIANGGGGLRYTFDGCKVLENINDIASWNLALSYAELEFAFRYCERLESLDLSSWDLSNLYSLAATFSECKNLQTVDLGNVFSTSVGQYNGANQGDLDLSSTFSRCYSLISIDSSIFQNVPSGLTLYLYQTFHSCENLSSPIDLSGCYIFTLDNAFHNCKSLPTIDMSGCVMSARSADDAFSGCKDLRSIDLSNLVAQTTSNGLNGTFNGTTHLAYLDLSSTYFNNGSKTASFLQDSGISKITLGSGFLFRSASLPAGDWKRESTGEIYTAAELKAAWNSSMADTYERVNVITFDGNGGQVSYPTRLIKQLDEVFENDDFPSVSKQGYTFLGWYTDRTAGVPVSAGDTITQSIYFARWSKNDYTLVLKKNADNDPSDEEVRISLAYDQVYQLSPSTFTNGNKVIQKWTTNSDGTGTAYGADERVVMLTNVDDDEFVLYAQWGKSQYVSISFDSQGGSEVSSLLVEKGSSVTPAQYVVPYRNGYTFAGWWTDPVNGERWDTTDHTAMESIQLIAKWEKDPVVTFDPNGGGYLSFYSRAVPSGGSLENLPYGSDANRKLKGFFTSSTFGQGTQLTTSTVITQDVTYYAQWGYQPYFNLAGGKYSSAYSVDTAYPLSASSMIQITSFPAVERDGYTLSRWMLPDGTTVNIGDTIDRSLVPEIIAEWTRNDTVTVTFNPNGGSLAMYGGATEYLCKNYEMNRGDALGYYPDAEKQVSSQRLEFLGWYDENDNLYTPDSIVNNDITLYAKWQDDTRVLYKFVVPGVIYQATSAYNNSVSTVSGNRVTSVYRTRGEEFGILPGLSIYKSGSTLNGKYLEGWYSDPEPYDTNGVLKPGVEKLLPTTAKTTESTWYAYIVDNVEDKFAGSMSYKYFAEWTNASNADVSNIDNNLEFHPQSNTTQTANLHMHFELNSEVSESLPAGSVRITIPRSVWKNWDGEYVGTTNISAQLAKYPSSKSGMFFSYAEDENGDYVILNNQQITGGAGVDLTIAYSVSPVLVPGGAVDNDKDYVPGYTYFDSTVPVKFEIDKDAVTTYQTVNNVPVLTNTFVADIQETINLDIEMHTFVKPSIRKAYINTYYEWSNAWGPKPDDADDYFYISWDAVYSYSNNQPFTLYITEDTIHDGTVVFNSFENANPSGKYISSGGSSSSISTTIITRHPKSLLQNIPATGVTLQNQVRLTADWKSGYKTEYVAPAEHTIYSWSYPLGEFNKTNVWGTGSHSAGFGSINNHAGSDPYYHTYSYAQNILLANNPINLQWELTYDGWSSGTPIQWDDTTHTYSRLQRVIALSDGNNSDIMYSSGKAYSKYVWEPPTGNVALSDNDYAVTALKLYLREYDGEYLNGEWGGPTIRDDVSVWNDAIVYVRYRNTNNLVYYTSIKVTKTVNGNDVYGSAEVTLPDNVVGWEVRYPSSYFRTYMQVNEKVTLYPTADVKSLIHQDFINGYSSIIKNRGYCDIWTSDDVFDAPAGVFFHATDWKGGFNAANKEIWVLTPQTGTLNAAKFSSDQGNVLFDVERGIQENPIAIKGWSYYQSGMMPLAEGVFYDLLPRGATVDRSSIYGYLSNYNTSSYATNDANSYNNTNSNYSGRLPKEYYDVEFVEDWENSGRTMMIIHYTAPDNTTNMATFCYLLRMTYADVISYGTSVQNDVAFMDVTGQNSYSSATEGMGVLGEDSNYYASVSLMEDHVAYAVAPTHYIPVDAFSWGFYKNVNTKDGYAQEEITIPNNLYTYKINYSQSDYATVNSMVFFDVLERGAYDNAFHNSSLNAASEWAGTFDSIDITPLLSLEKDGSTASNPIYCAPVVYYSTKSRDQFTATDWDTSNTSTWTTTMPAKDQITAIAVDCTKSSDASDFVLKGRNSAVFYIRMRSSIDPNDVDKDAVNQAMFYAEVNGTPTEETSDTVVTLIDEEPEIHKVSDPVSGTAVAPALVAVNDDIEYTISIKNTNTEFSIPNIVVEDEIPAAVQASVDDIKVHFGNPANAMSLHDSPRARMRVSGRKLIFTINSLEPDEVCYFIIPCKAKVIGQVADNTAVITSVNDVQKEIESETTYHEVRVEVPFSKVNTLGELVPGAILQLWNTDGAEDELVEQWTTTGSKYTVLLLPGNYVLKELQAPTGYDTADDIVFEIQSDGTIVFEDTTTGTTITMVDEQVVHVYGTKSWKYDDPSDRSSSVTIRLMRKIEGEPTPTYTGESITVTAQDNWNYDFGNMPKYDTNGHEYIYSIEENAVTNYTPTYVSGDPDANGLAITFNNRTSTYDESDYFMLYYLYDGRTYGKMFYGISGQSTNPAGITVHIPTNEFWIAFESNGSNNDYGFKIDQIIPVQTQTALLINDRVTPPSWTSSATSDEYGGGNFPETDHNYSVYDKTKMHYSRNIGGESYDVINVKDTPGFDIPFNKINENNELIGGVRLRLTSVPEPGDAEIQPIEWTTVAGQSHTEHLYPGHYLLHEVTAAAGYLYADDIAFVVDGEGNVIIDETTLSSVDMLDKSINQPYPFKKDWMDTGYESLRPASVTFNLVRVSDGQTVQTVTLTSSDADDAHTWSGAFDPVPVVDNNMEPIEYAVREVVNGNDYIVYHDVQNKVGFYVTFSADSDLGTNAYMKIYPLGYSDPDHPGARRGKGALVLDSSLNLSSAEGIDMAGKTYFVPILDGVEGFIISKQLINTALPDDSVNLEIESIIPATVVEPYALIGNTGPAASDFFYGSDYPDMNDGVTGSDTEIHTFIWLHQEDSAYNIVNTASIDEIVNYINKTDVSFVKRWENENNDTSGRPSTVTFNLYNQRDTSTVVATMTVPAGTDASNSYTFTGVPKNNPDGTIADYVVREASVSGYYTYYSPDVIFGLLVTFSNNSTAGSGTLSLYSKNTNFMNNNAAVVDYENGNHVSGLTGSQMAGKTYYVQVVDPYHPGFVMELVDDTAKTANISVTSVVPVGYSNYTTASAIGPALEPTINEYFSGSNYPTIHLTNASTSTSRYVAYDYDVTQAKEIHNFKNVTSVPVTKIWSEDAAADRPASITINAYNVRTPDTVSGSVTLTSSDADTGTQWSGTITGLPMYNADGTLAQYVLKETPLSDYRAMYNTPRGMLVTFSDDSFAGNNGTLAPIRLYSYSKENDTLISNVWSATESSPDISGYMVSGNTFYIPIEEKGSYAFVVYKPEQYSNIRVESVRLTTQAQPYNHSDSGVQLAANTPVYQGAGQLDMKYRSGYFVYDFNGVVEQADNGGASIDGIVTNERPQYYIAFNKHSESCPILPGATLQVLRAADDSLVEQWESNVYDHEILLSPGNYVLHEAAAPTGFAQADDIEFTLATDGTLTVNNQTVQNISMMDNELAEIKGQKSWVGDNASQRPASITVNLYQNGQLIDSVAATAAGNWQYSFTDKPRYDSNGDPYTYTVSETAIHDYTETVLATSSSESWVTTQSEWDMPGTYSVVMEPVLTQVPALGYRMVLSSQSRSESANYDYFYIYYRKNGQLYKITGGQGSSNSGRFGGTGLANKTIDIPSNDIYIVWRSDTSQVYWGFQVVDMIPLDTEVTVTATAQTALPATDGSYSFGTPIEYTGTNYPETGHNYANNERIIYHWTGNAFVNGYVDAYTVSADNGLLVTFDNEAVTHGENDKLTFYCLVNDTWYVLPTELSGNMNSAQVVIPSRTFVMKWESDSSGTALGWKIDSIVDYANASVPGCQPATLPSGTQNMYQGSRYPEHQHYSNNETVLYRYLGDGLELPVAADRYGYQVTANITNTRMPDKQNYSIYKQRPDTTLLGGATLRITGRETGASIDIEPIQWTSSSNGPQVVQLRAGQYVLHEVTPPPGYQGAADIPFTIDSTGALIINNITQTAIYMTDLPQTTIAVDKVDYNHQSTSITGAVLRLYDSNSTALTTWTSDGTPHDITEYVTFGNSYRLHEVSAPAGFNIMSEDITVNIASDGTVTLATTEWAVVTGNSVDGYVIKMYNNQGVHFPSTGASDRIWVYLGSVMTLLASAALLIRRKRRHSNA